MMSFYTGPAIVLIPIAGILADRFSRKAVLVPSLFIFGIAGTAIAFTNSFQVVLALRLLQGIGISGITPLLMVIIRDMYDGSKESTAQGLRVTGSSIASGALPLLAGALVTIAWQVPFLLTAVAIPIGLATYLWFEEPTNLDEVTEEDNPDSDSYLREIISLIKLPRVLVILIGRALPVMLWIGFATYVSIVVVRIMGGTPRQAGLIVALWTVGSAIGSSQAGRVTALQKGRLRQLITTNTIMGVGFFLVFFSPNIYTAAAGAFAGGFGIGVSVSLFMSVLTGLASRELRGGVVSLGVSFNRVIQTVTPVIMGGMIAFGTPIYGFAPTVQIVGTGIAILGAGGSIICLLVAVRYPPSPDETAELLTGKDSGV